MTCGVLRSQIDEFFFSIECTRWNRYDRYDSLSMRVVISCSKCNVFSLTTCIFGICQSTQTGRDRFGKDCPFWLRQKLTCHYHSYWFPNWFFWIAELIYPPWSLIQMMRDRRSHARTSFVLIVCPNKISIMIIISKILTYFDLNIVFLFVLSNTCQKSSSSCEDSFQLQ